MKDLCFSAADILLPDFSLTDGERWACIACDQFTEFGGKYDHKLTRPA